MPFVEINVKNEIEKQKQNDPEFRKAWDDSRAEYRLIGEMISLRKQENITQKKLASLTGNKQQVISRNFSFCADILPCFSQIFFLCGTGNPS